MFWDQENINTLADDVEKQLLEYLCLHHLKFGDLLPKETELSEQLHISRHIVREGISRLKALGIVESKKRRGTILCRPNPFSGFQKLAQAKLFTGNDRRNFMELRIAIELGMCDFIYARRSGEKIRALRQAAEKPLKDFSAEVHFHSKLMDFAENPAAENFREVLVLAFGMENFKRSTLKTPSHQDICDVLEQGTSSDFQQIMRQHFLPYLNFSTV